MSSDRPVSSYRPQHDEDCAAQLCVECGNGEGWWRHHSKNRSWELGHAFAPAICSCGLDAALALKSAALRAAPVSADAAQQALSEWEAVKDRRYRGDGSGQDRIDDLIQSGDALSAALRAAVSTQVRARDMSQKVLAKALAELRVRAE